MQEATPPPTLNGICLPGFKRIKEKGPEKAVQDIIELESRENDIMLCSYPKSGAHWISEIMAMLQSNTTTLSEDDKVNTMLEAIDDLDCLKNLPSPRILNTHLLFKYLPKMFQDGKGKIVHIIRNPKDVMVSAYYHQLKAPMIKFEGTWDDYFEHSMSEPSPVLYGSWFNYELDFEQIEKENVIYTCSYEQLKKNTVVEILKLSEFLNYNCTKQRAEEIAAATTFDNMKENKIDITKDVDGKGFIYRKGEIGDWKNHFTVKQNQTFDAYFKVRMQGSSLEICFE